MEIQKINFINKSKLFVSATKKESLERKNDIKHPIKRFFKEIIELISNEFEVFLKITRDNSIKNEEENEEEIYFHSISGYDFLSEIWNSIFQILNSKEIGFLYGVGLADLFFINYEISMDFLDNFKIFYDKFYQKNVIFS